MSSTVARDVVRVELDVVAHGVRREEAVDAARGQQLLVDDLVEQPCASAKSFARLLALLRVVEDRG